MALKNPQATEALDVPILTSARVVCRDTHVALHLPHIVSTISDFLDFSGQWTLARACEANMLRLTHRLITKDESESAASYRMSQEYRDFMFRKLVSNAANLGNWDTLKFLSSSTYFQWCRFRPCTVRDIAYAGRLDILKWLAAYRSDVVLTSLDVTKAIKGGHFDVAKELVATVAMRPEGSVEIWMEAAAAMGGFDLLKWFCSQYEGSIPESALLHAVSNGHLTIVKWIIDQNCIDVQSELFRFWLGNAVSHGHLDTVKWIIRRYPTKCGFTVNTHWSAIEQGTVETMKLLWTANPEPYSPRMIEVAAARGDLDIVKWLCEHKTNKPLGNLIDAAAEGGSLDVVKWLHENTQAACTTSAMMFAARDGRLCLLKWLHENRKEGCTNSAMDMAACCGHLEIIKWLHTNRSEGCTTQAMDFAAINGHLDVVMWLHTHRNEGCTHFAMDIAAGYNQLEVVRWLHGHRDEGCTTFAMDEASRNGHLEMVRWLTDHRTEGCTNAAIDAAVGFGHFDVALYLHQAHKASGNVLEIVRDGGNQCKWEFADWLYAHDPKEFVGMVADLFR